MKKIMSILILFSTNVYAYHESYKIGGTVILFETRDEVMVNASCFEKPCTALKQARINKNKELENGLLAGGKNPEAVKCKTLMNGIVVFGTNREGHQQSFCYFADDESYLKN